MHMCLYRVLKQALRESGPNRTTEHMKTMSLGGLLNIICNYTSLESCVNYPVKPCLIKMKEHGQIDMEGLSCVPWQAIGVCSVGAEPLKME